MATRGLRSWEKNLAGASIDASWRVAALSGRARTGDGQLAAQPDVVRRRADADVEDAGLDRRADRSPLIPGELRRRQREGDARRLLRLQRDAAERPQRAERLIRAAPRLVRV